MFPAHLFPFPFFRVLAQETGQCPVTKQPLSVEDLVAVQTSGAIKPLCDLIVCSDARIVTVALEGLENILKVGEALRANTPGGAPNQYAQLIDEAEGLEKIENLQNHNKV